MNPKLLNHFELLSKLLTQNGHERDTTLKLASPQQRGMILSTCISQNDATHTTLALNVLDHTCIECDYNFGLQNASYNNNLTLVEALLYKSSIISVSRSLIKASASAHLDVLKLLVGRLDKEHGWDHFDMAVSLREAANSQSSRSEQYIKYLSTYANDSSKAWALGECIARKQASAVHLLLNIGANALELPTWPSMRNRTETPYAIFLGLRQQPRFSTTDKVALESIELALGIKSPSLQAEKTSLKQRL